MCWLKDSHKHTADSPSLPKITQQQNISDMWQFEVGEGSVNMRANAHAQLR